MKEKSLVIPEKKTQRYSISVLEKMADYVVKSNLFGITNKDQAVALMLLAEAEGIHPMRAVQEYDIIKGKPSLKAKAKLRRFLNAGGKVTWHELSDTCAKATFEHPQGGKVTIEWTIERAKRAGLYDKKNRDGSPNTWQRFTRQMLRSRVISEGVDTVFPITTLYTPEEVIDMVGNANNAPNFGSEETFDVEAIVDTSEPGKANPVENTKPGAPKPIGSKSTSNKPKKKGFYGFLEACREVKKELQELGREGTYYNVLDSFGYKHSNEVPKDRRDLQEAVYRALRNALKYLKEELAKSDINKEREELRRVAHEKGFSDHVLDSLAKTKYGKMQIDMLNIREIKDLMQFVEGMGGQNTPIVEPIEGKDSDESCEDLDEDFPY